MDLIPGGKGANREMHEKFMSPERGDIHEVIGAIENQTGQSVDDLLKILDIEEHYIFRVRESLSRAAYRVTAGESIATDLDLNFGGNLVDQLAELRGVDCVKIHLSVFDAMKEAASRHAIPEGVTPQQLTWTWEIGRYVGRTLQRSVDAYIAPLSIPSHLGIINFFEKSAIDLVGDSRDFKLPAEKDIKIGAVQDYRQVGLPERLASALGGVFLQHFHGVSSEFQEAFEVCLREAVVKPVILAEDFGTEFRPEMSYRELAASHPLSNEELQNYLEYICEPSDTIYLHDR